MTVYIPKLSLFKNSCIYKMHCNKIDLLEWSVKNSCCNIHLLIHSIQKPLQEFVSIKGPNLMKIRFSYEHLPEKMITMIFFLPSLYYSLANLVAGYTIIYLVCFLCGGIAYLLLVRKATTAFVILFSLMIALSYTYFVNPSVGYYILSTSSLNTFSKSRIVLLLLVYITPFLIAVSNKIDYDYMLKYLFWCSVILLPLDMVINIKRLTSTKTLDYMTISYQLLFWTIIAIFYCVEKRKKWPLIIVLPSVLSILTGGSRGALLCLSVTILLVYIFKNLLADRIANHRSRRIFQLVSLIFIIILLVFFNNFLLEIENTLDSWGIKSRVITRIINASFFDNADRTNIQKELFPYLNNRVFGYGLYGDRFLTSSGKYAHNFFVELLIDFGVVIGGIIIIALIINTIRAFLICIKKKTTVALYFLFFSIVFIYIKFMISASYLESSECLFAIGIIINIIRYRNDEEINCE